MATAAYVGETSGNRVIDDMKQSFREQFKLYKRKNIPLDLSQVINFKNLENRRSDQNCFKIIKCDRSENDEALSFGMKVEEDWEIYELLSKPGLFFIKNPFLSNGQRYWIIRCLKYFTKKPNKLNIDAHNILESDDDWWEYCQRKSNLEFDNTILEKLRWATFGYHHNWDTKEYCESSKSNFPQDLRVLCSYVAEKLHLDNFNAEASIVNFYHFDSTLSGHKDQSEVNIKAPLFSFSFGQSAIFLIGGDSLEDETIPILLESGDVLIMSGDCRLHYHGIPKILPSKLSPWNEVAHLVINNYNQYYLKEVTNDLLNNDFWEPFESYVNKSRINLNVRQVLLPGQKSLS